MVKYTKEHIEDIAELIRWIPLEQRQQVAESFANKFGLDNPRFYEPYFLHACRVQFGTKKEIQEGLTRHDVETVSEGNCYYASEEDFKNRIITCYNEYLGKEVTHTKRLNPVKNKYWEYPFISKIEIEAQKFMV